MTNVKPWVVCFQFRTRIQALRQVTTVIQVVAMAIRMAARLTFFEKLSISVIRVGKNGTVRVVVFSTWQAGRTSSAHSSPVAYLGQGP